MSTKKKYSKSKFLKEAKETYKSILIAEGFLDVLVDLVFGSSIKNASNKLTSDPEFVKGVKKLRQLEREMGDIQKKYLQIKEKQLADYFVMYGIDLYDLDRHGRAMELYSLNNRVGKYKNLKPLSKQQQEFNRKLVSKKRY